MFSLTTTTIQKMPVLSLAQTHALVHYLYFFGQTTDTDIRKHLHRFLSIVETKSGRIGVKKFWYYWFQEKESEYEQHKWHIRCLCSFLDTLYGRTIVPFGDTADVTLVQMFQPWVDALEFLSFNYTIVLGAPNAGNSCAHLFHKMPENLKCAFPVMEQPRSLQVKHLQNGLEQFHMRDDAEFHLARFKIRLPSTEHMSMAVVQPKPTPMDVDDNELFQIHDLPEFGTVHWTCGGEDVDVGILGDSFPDDVQMNPEHWKCYVGNILVTDKTLPYLVGYF